MNSSELETWAVRNAARNSHPFDWITPVLLYRNGKAGLCGAYTQMNGNKEVILTAAHGFSVDYPYIVWSFRKLIPKPSGFRTISKAVPMRDVDDDVAVCTPASVLETSTDPLPNFYQGLHRNQLDMRNFRPLDPNQGMARSVLTGKEVRVMAEVLINGKLHVMLDLDAGDGQSGSIFVDELGGKMYILRAYSPAMLQDFRKRIPNSRKFIKHGTAFAVRIAYA